MPIEYPAVLELRESGRRFSWTDRDTILYALAIGMGSDPINPDELKFVYEKHLRAVPTLATVVAWGADVGPDRIGLNRGQTLHGAESLTWHQPMPAAGTVIAESRVVAAYDKGDKGAVIERETLLRDAATDELLVTITRSAFARADGGFGGPSQSPAVHETPRRVPDAVLEFTTRRDQALIYRLCGDRNPLHADPEVAHAAGFSVPILHGLCTYGIGCRALLQTYCGFDPSRLKGYSVRFSAPVLPGDVVTVKLWKDGETVSLEAEVPARGVTVIKNGKSHII
jgi:acyl dehydratase